MKLLGLELEPDHVFTLGQYLGASLVMGFGAIGAGLGMGATASHAQKALLRQPAASGQILRTMLIGQAAGCESAAIFALLIGLFIMVFPKPEPQTIEWNIVAAFVGAALSVGIGCCGSGTGNGWAAARCCESVARNPRRITQLTSTLIIGQAVAETATVFAVVVSLLILFRPHVGTSWNDIGACLGAGLAMGLGAVGPGMGSGRVAAGALEGIGHWPQSRGIVIRTMLVAQAVCDTTAVFGLMAAFLMLVGLQIADSLTGFAQCIGAAIAVGLGGIGPAVGCGWSGERACLVTAENPRRDAVILRVMIIGQAVAQSCGIYGLIVALIILYVRTG